MSEITVLGKINAKILEHEFGVLKTTDIIITRERINHIKSHHAIDYHFFEDYGKEAVENPDIVIKDIKHDNTVFMIKRLNAINLNVIVKLVLADNEGDLKNSVMTFYRIRHKNLVKLQNNNKVLYKEE